MKKTSTRPPKTLSPEARQWWAALVAAFELDDEAGLLILQVAMESLDRLRQAQAVLHKEGIVIKDRFGAPKQHPATMVERDSRTALMRSLKALNLDVAPGLPVGRPPTVS